MCTKKRSKAIKRIRSKFDSNYLEILVFKTAKHIYVQLNDLSCGKTIASVSTVSKLSIGLKKNVDSAFKLGVELATKFLQSDCKNLVPVFNRAEYIFHGIVKSVADGFYTTLRKD